MFSLLPKQDSFIVTEGFANWFNLSMPMYYCEFEQKNYSDLLFSRLNIQFSDSLQNAVVKRRSEFLAGRYCAINSMRMHGICTDNLKIGRHRNPLWPDMLIGSISHCDNLAVAITSNRCSAFGIGIDIETEVDISTMESISRQVLSCCEQAFMQDQGDRLLCLLFTIIFSVKESFFKAAYPLVEEYFDFDTVSVINVNWDSGTLQLHVNKTLHKEIEKGMIVNGAFTILPHKKVATLVILRN